ncbi:hypothetical protein PHYPSEUDO_005639 [Phytophthora pseudosyringae]|uniref:Uncharacterized protein n=1 Tax=Phytophthora pseudosyringae TaxID=221518 RepID=A0A8T1VKP8_9STRA|nr:hypothetical protein PHYPSEUDO_005639 [Phytophthora pseudosyringae]
MCSPNTHVCQLLVELKCPMLRQMLSARVLGAPHIPLRWVGGTSHKLAGRDSAMPPTRYIFADLDALNQDVCKYMRAHSNEFSDAELTKHFPISAHKLTKLLSRPDDATKYLHGSYYYLKFKDVEAFRAAGWAMRPKSESKYRTLGHLPKPKRNPEGDGEQDESKTLVLVAGKLAGSVLFGVDKYFEAGWCVQCYCFRDSDSKMYDRLASEHPDHFKCIYLNNSVRSLIKEISGDYEMMFTARDAPRTVMVGDATKSDPTNHKLSSLYEHIHELQVKVLAMEADSEAQRTKEHDDVHHQLQRQQEAFAHQLRQQDEDFQKRLREHRKTATFLRKHHEQVVEERVKVCADEVATALSNLGELSERVKQDVDEYQRARLEEELARWRRDAVSDFTGKPSSSGQEDKEVHSTLLDAVDFVLKQNGVQTGIKNWKVALAVLAIHKITAWLSSDSFVSRLVPVPRELFDSNHFPFRNNAVKPLRLADLDALNEDVRAHMEACRRQFPRDVLARQFPLDPFKLTELLSSPSGEMKVFRGTYYKLAVGDVNDFRDAGWDLRPKSSVEHRTLENLLKRNLADDASGTLGAGKKTLVLVGGDPTNSILDRVELYFTAGWRVQFYCFRERGSEVSDRLCARYPSHLQRVYLGGFIKKLLRGTSSAACSVDLALGVPFPVGNLTTEAGDQRFVLMNIDDMVGTLRASDKMYMEIPGAKSARESITMYLAVQDNAAGIGASSRTTFSGRFSRTTESPIRGLDAKRDNQQMYLESRLKEQKEDFERQLREQQEEFHYMYKCLKACMQQELTYKLREMDAKWRTVFGRLEDHVEWELRGQSKGSNADADNPNPCGIVGALILAVCLCFVLVA